MGESKNKNLPKAVTKPGKTARFGHRFQVLYCIDQCGDSILRAAAPAELLVPGGISWSH